MRKHRGALAWLRILAVVLAALLAASPGLLAQAADEGDEEQSVSLLRRFSFGASMTTPINGIIREGDTSDTVTSTSGKTTTTLDTTVKSVSTLKRIGGGVTAYFDLNRRFSIGTSVLYRSAGYDRTTTMTSTTSGVATTETEVEKTRAAYWEIPVLARVYAAEVRPLRTRVFFTGGGACRLVRGIDTVRDFQHSGGASDTSRTPAVPDARMSFGPVVGGGLQWQDDTGLRVTPEFRYTRWFDRAWDRGPTRSSLSQIEFVLSLTF